MSNKNQCFSLNKAIKFIDTHFHPIEFKDSYEEKTKKIFCLDEFLEILSANKLYKLISISTKVQDISFYETLSDKNEKFYFSVGIHPCEIEKNFKEELFFLKNEIKRLLLKNKKICGIGEVGIDLFHSKDNFINQKIAFVEQINMAIDNNLPLFIHTRNASNETYEILSDFKNKNIKGIIHCFCDDYFWAKKFVDLNFKLGIGGIITYPKNEQIRDAVKKIGIENIVYETDAPYLPPQSKRGKLNSPEYIPEINDYLAEYLNIDKIILAEKIFLNTNEIIKFN